ncbi:MAG: ABC transporter ATP-binding protein [bacterium]
MNAQNNMAVQIENISKIYDGRYGAPVSAVIDVNWDVKNEEILLISGPNGSGKTTLLSIIGCLIKPSSGSIRILGHEVTRLSQKELAVFRLKNIGFIFQSFRLLDCLTVIENVELPLNLIGLPRSSSKQQATEMLKELNMIHRARFYPKALSGGEKQRVAIARALVNDPVLLLADEPTGSLDSHSGQLVIELLCEAARRRKKTVVIVSHDTRIHNYAHRVLIMEDGCTTEEIGG